MRMPTLVLSVAVALVFSAPANAQVRRLMSGGHGNDNYYFRYATYMEPGIPELSLSGGTSSGDGVIHRVMADRSQRVYFGYDVRVEPLGAADQYRITFTPLSDLPERLLESGDNPASWRALSAPDWRGPAVRTVRHGEVLSLDLLTNPATGQKITDYVTVMGSSTEDVPQLGPWPNDYIYERGLARDFRVQDTWMDLDVNAMTVNGKAVRFGSAMAGAIPYFSLPEYGRFALSLAPYPEYGFAKAGEVRGSMLSFTVGGQTFMIFASGRIAPGDGPFNLYVRHDTGANIGTSTGAVGQPRDLLR